jgi:uncharacterized protein (DUF433 family)
MRLEIWWKLPSTIEDSQSKLMNMSERIEINPAICHGKPVIRGTRVLVCNILRALAGGDSPEQIIEDYPNIDNDDIRRTTCAC